MSTQRLQKNPDKYIPMPTKDKTTKGTVKTLKIIIEGGPRRNERLINNL